MASIVEEHEGSLPSQVVQYSVLNNKISAQPALTWWVPHV